MHPYPRPISRARTALRAGALAAAIALPAAGAAAQEAASFSLSGFGTVGVVRSDNDQADYTSNAIFQPNGAGRSRRTSADVDSKVGVQGIGNWGPRWSALVQVVAFQNYDNDYAPHVEWANLTFRPVPDLAIRVGRILVPLHQRAESQNVGYGNPFVRNAAELIANVPNQSNDGIDVTYRFQAGAAVNATSVYAGRSRRNTAGRGMVTGQNFFHEDDVAGISHTAEVGDLKLQAGYIRFKYNLQYFDFIENGVAFDSLTAGFTFDPGPWFATADILKADDRAFGKATAITAGAGVRLGAFAPYVNYSSLEQDSVGSTGFGLVGDKQTVTSAGIRWDFARNMALKLQFDKVKSGPIALLFPTRFVNVQPEGFLANPRAKAVSATFDFIF